VATLDRVRVPFRAKLLDQRGGGAADLLADEPTVLSPQKEAALKGRRQ